MLNKLDENVWCYILYLKGNKFVAICIFWIMESSYGFMILCVCFDLLTNKCCICFTTLQPLWTGTWNEVFKICICILNHNHYWYIDACLIFKYSIQRSEFDCCANLAQSGGTFSAANGANLTLLVRQLLFFYRQNEDSKRLVSTVTYFDL